MRYLIPRKIVGGSSQTTFRPRAHRLSDDGEPLCAPARQIKRNPDGSYESRQESDTIPPGVDPCCRCLGT